ncbi:MAG: glycosyltransferase family 39 protein [Pirellulales bacterium]
MTDASTSGVESFWIRRSGWIVGATAALIFFANLGGAGLWDEDEPRNAACTAEMLRRGDWVVPMFNGQYRCQKPVMLYWLQMASYGAFGQSEFAARVPSALLSVGTCLLTWWLGRMLRSPRVGLLGGLLLATALMFDVAARASTPDGCLIFGVTLTLACYARLLDGRSRQFRPRRVLSHLALDGAHVRRDGLVAVGQGADRRTVADRHHGPVRVVRRDRRQSGPA